MGEVEPSDDTLTFIGTATVLMRCGGFTILTDPNFLHQGDHAHLGWGLRSRRLTQPAMEIAELPPLDFIVLSHHHGDHFDDVAARDLPKDVPIVTEPGSARKLREQGFTDARAVETWEDVRFERAGSWVRVTAVPARHAPEPVQRLLPKVMGSVLEFGSGERLRRRMYITGDTLHYERLREISERYPDIDLCIIHLGGTRIAGVLLTMDAEQGVRTLRLIAPRWAVPVHYDDYTVFTSPLADFRTAVDAAGLSTEVIYVDRGQTVALPPARS